MMPQRLLSSLPHVAVLSSIATLWLSGCGGSETSAVGAPNSAAASAPAVQKVPVRRLENPDAAPRRVREAVERAVAQVEAASADPRAHGELGMLYEANRLWSEALACYGTAASLDPSEPMWVLHGAYAFQSLGKSDEALALLSDTASMYVGCAPLQQLLGELAYEAGDAARAESAFRAALAAAPESCEPLVGLAELALDAGRTDEAVELLEKAISIDPRYRAPHFLLGRALAKLGRDEEAARETARGAGGARRRMRDRIQERIETYELDLERILQRATAMLDARRTEQALALLERHAPAFPRDARLAVNAGNACLSLGRTADAIVWYDKALAIAPDEFLVHTNRANCLLAMGRAEEARAAAQRSLELSATYGPSYLVLARAHEALGSAAEAQTALRKGVELDPRNPALRQAIAAACTAAGLHEEALEHCRVQAEIVPEDWRSFAQLAFAAADAKRADDARAALERARALAPSDPAREQAEQAVLELLKP
jgi:tetratricopeptide (TPR) repeat protein